MASPDLQRKAFIFIVVAGVAIAALAALPFVEHWLQTGFFPQLGWVFESNWQLSRDSAAGSMIAPAFVEHELTIISVSPRVDEEVVRLRGELGLPNHPASIEGARLEQPQLESAPLEHAS